MPDADRLFMVEDIPARRLDALLLVTEREGHTLQALLAQRVETTTQYRYTAIFARAGEATPASPGTTTEENP